MKRSRSRAEVAIGLLPNSSLTSSKVSTPGGYAKKAYSTAQAKIRITKHEKQVQDEENLENLFRTIDPALKRK